MQNFSTIYALLLWEKLITTILEDFSKKHGGWMNEGWE
jgi:hypothetical protein